MNSLLLGLAIGACFGYIRWSAICKDAVDRSAVDRFLVSRWPDIILFGILLITYIAGMA